jgi:transcriptional regulator with XRE-family HTH domain
MPSASQAIYAARKVRSLRQSDLAELSGIAQADISRIERGQIAPTTPTVLKLADRP